MLSNEGACVGATCVGAEMCAAAATFGDVAGAGDSGAFDAEASGAGARMNHQPSAPAATIAINSSGKTPLRRREVANGVPKSGASPSRRFASDFFRASRINDMDCAQVIRHSDKDADRHRPTPIARTGFPAR
jgi:hypothetical protein